VTNPPKEEAMAAKKKAAKKAATANELDKLHDKVVKAREALADAVQAYNDAKNAAG
jgi:chloramphenicol 3-O-phosphotransferase